MGLFGNMKNYNELVRWSIKRDFEGATFKRLQEQKKRDNGERRIAKIEDSSFYAPFRRFLVGRLVRIIKSGYGGGYWVEFVFEQDREKLINAAGWSNEKRQFLLDGVKFK